jgi:hypothetical protein
MCPRQNGEQVLPAQAAVPEGDHHGQPVADHHHDDGERPQEVDVAVTACRGGGGEVPNPHPVLRHRASSQSDSVIVSHRPARPFGGAGDHGLNWGEHRDQHDEDGQGGQQPELVALLPRSQGRLMQTSIGASYVGQRACS